MSQYSRPNVDEPAQNPGSGMENQPRLGRKGMLFFVVVLPVLIVGALWKTMDRSRGTPRPDMSGALGPGQRAPIGGELPPDPPPQVPPTVP